MMTNMNPPTGTEHERFIVERSVGTGGMGAVYRATDRYSGVPVALKIAFDSGEEYCSRALNEAGALAALDHPAIVRLVASGIGMDGRPYLAMEWLDGEDLATRLRRGALTLVESVLVGIRLGEGLAAAHAVGIVHRDLKPSNIFLPEGSLGAAKLVDFGIARVGHRRMTATGMIVGTPGYMAPEQAMGRSDVGASADVFALGSVLYECMTGESAFSGDHVLGVLAKVLFEEVPPLESRREGIPTALSLLIAQMLRKSPTERPTAAEVVQSLASILPKLVETMPTPGVVTDRDPALKSANESALSLSDEQRLVCVLVVRSSAMPVNGPAMDDALENLRAVVAPLGGRAERVLDGTIIASWTGDGVARDLAARAARAALLARERLPGAVLALGSGLAALGGTVRFGPALDRAILALGAANGVHGVVLLDDITAGLIDDRFHIEVLESAIKLITKRTLDEGEVRLLLGRVAPCVGRERELRVLGDLLDECIDEQRACGAIVTAPAGIGKSRLRHELLRSARLRGEIKIWTAEADELGAGSPFSLIGEALQRVIGIRANDTLEERRSKLAASVHNHVRSSERSRVTAFLGEICMAHAPEAAHPLLAAARRDPGLMAEQVRRAFQDLLAAETAVTPVLIVLEDLHWGDLPSLRLLAAAMTTLRDRPLMVLGFARPEARERCPELWAIRELQEIRLNGLTRRAASQLVRNILPTVDEALVMRLVERADGNALYLEELLRAVASGRTNDLPETIAAMVQDRLADLPMEQRRILRAASIFGGAFWPSAVEALLGIGSKSIPATLGTIFDVLVERELVERRPESRFPGEIELTFRHALIRDGAYALMTENDRAMGHLRAAEWLERKALERERDLQSHNEVASGSEWRQVWRDRSEEAGSARIARHFELGGAKDRAVEWHARSAQHALLAGDPEGAAESAHQGLGLLEVLADDAARTSVELRLQLSLFRALMLTQGYTAPDVERAVFRAKQLCPNDAVERSIVLYGLWQLHIAHGKAWIARSFAADLLNLAMERQDPNGTMAGHLALGMSCLFLGEHHAAREHFEQSLARIERTHASYSHLLMGADFEVYSLCYLSLNLWALGDFDEGLSSMNRALALAERLAHPFTSAVAASFAAIHHQHRGDRQAALTYAERTHALAIEHRFHHYALESTILRGWAHIDPQNHFSISNDSHDDVVGAMEQALNRRRTQGANVATTYLLALQAEAQTAMGNIDAALATLEDAVVTMNQHGERMWAPEVHRLMGQICHKRGGFENLERAEEYLLRAIDIARSQGSLTMELRATMSLAKLWNELGNGDEGLQLLDRVCSRFPMETENRDWKDARALLGQR
jgi:eukaryotic-like serine/threonine-protein kinase